MSGAVIKNYEEFTGKHNFLAEELLQPMSNRSDVGRTNMFCSHVAQAVVLDEPEIPQVFSRFENAFGAYTSAVKVLPEDAVVLSVFEKNPLQKIYAIQYADGKVDIHFAKPVRHLTESYGYRLNNTALEGIESGDSLPQGTQIQGWSCTDEDGNFRYGANFKTVYMNLHGKTYEDGIIASYSTAERLAHTTIEEVVVVMNANDLTVNRHGTPDHHQGFPDVGQTIQEGVLLARRRINHESILFDLSNSRLSKINWDADTVFYADGAVVDIDVYSNLTREELDKNPFNRQILEYYDKWEGFRQWVMDVFGGIVEQEGERLYSDDVAFWYRQCRDGHVGTWRYERSEFDGVVLRFTIARRNKLKVGSKVTNRSGGKGVISELLPDDEMPTTEDGRRADLVINSLGVVNRLNPVQLFESELTFIADEVARQMGQMTTNNAYAHLIKFLTIVSSEQAVWMSKLSKDIKADLVHEITSGKEPIFIHQAPFFGNCSLEALEQAYKEFNVEKVKFVGIEEPMILGTNYYMKLRHEPTSKMSARSAKHLSIGGVPTKNGRGVRSGTEHHSTTPIRLGEQELENLFIADEPEELKRFLRIYATDDVSREGAISELLMRQDPFSYDEVKARGNGVTRPVAGLKALLESVGLELDGNSVNEEIDTEEVLLAANIEYEETDETSNNSQTE